MNVALPTLAEDFVEAMAQSLAALKPWCHWLARVQGMLASRDEGPACVSGVAPCSVTKRQYEELLHAVLRTAISSIGSEVITRDNSE
jgi:hypothetical protein